MCIEKNSFRKFINVKFKHFPSVAFAKIVVVNIAYVKIVNYIGFTL
jgi:hypothetical protein